MNTRKANTLFDSIESNKEERLKDSKHDVICKALDAGYLADDDFLVYCQSRTQVKEIETLMRSGKASKLAYAHTFVHHQDLAKKLIAIGEINRRQIINK